MSVPPSLDLLDSPAEAAAVRRLPFAFAKRHGVLLQAGRVVYRPGAALMAVAEALRFPRLKGKDLSRSKLESINKSVPFSPLGFDCERDITFRILTEVIVPLTSKVK